MSFIISGIQQMGVGVKDAPEAWKWYRRYFEANVPVFQDEAVADLMLPYTGGEPRKRFAILALNMQGGGGFEIWQYKSRVPQPPSFDIQLGDLGIFACKIKCRNIEATYQFYEKEGVEILSPIDRDVPNSPHFYIKDPYGNVFQIVESHNWFAQKTGKRSGGTYGAIIGVSDIDKSLPLYTDILGYNKVIYDQTAQFPYLKNLAGGNKKFRRVVLEHSKEREGAFSKLLGKSQIELVQAMDYTPKKIFENRFWGDLGFIHLCFDINGMDELEAKCKAAGHPFTVDSKNSFDMGEAAGRFTYIEDADGTLIEFVETHKVPILKKIGWYLNLKNRNPRKPLPRWMLKAMGLNQVKD